MSRATGINLLDSDNPLNIMPTMEQAAAPKLQPLVKPTAATVAPTAVTTAVVADVDPPGLRAFGDPVATRKAVYDSVFKTLSTLPPVENKRHILKLTNVQWADPDNFTKKQRKEAVLRGDTMGRRINGTWELYDKESGQLLDKRQQTVLRVPHLTDGGTYVHGGGEYGMKNQQRLRPGVFGRIRNNGEIESHVNVLTGGPSHRYYLDPAKGVFYLKLGQASIPLLPLMHHLGATDQQLREAWGDDLYARNYAKADGSATAKLVKGFVRGEIPDGHTGPAIRAAFEKMQLDPEVTKRTLGHPHERVDADTILSATKKLLAISRKEVEPDDRDHLAYQTFLGPEEMFSERLGKDRAGVRRQLLFKMSLKGNLQRMPSSALQTQIDSALMDSGLGQHLEEVNPAEILDKNTQISRMGEGGIASYDSVPDEARSVQPSHFGFIDPVRTPESFAAGVDVYLSNNVRKADDGKLYARFTDGKTGKPVWKSPQDAADAVVTFPGAMNLPNYPKIPAMQNGRLTWVKKSEVNLVLPSMEHAFSPIGNLVPLKSEVKQQRVAMASRMITQALALKDAQAPLVQSGLPGSDNRSYEDEYGKHMGAEFASTGGRVMKVSPDAITVQYEDGRTADVELHNNLPYNRKSFLHQTSAVQPGQRFAPGQLLARSNFTDANGTVALGLNARVAYMPWGGLNYEDASVISESMAKRLSSEHAYQHQLEVNDRTKVGRSAYVSLFPSKYDKATLAKMDDKGIVKSGTQVSFGDPLILGAEQQAMTQNKIHKKGQPSFHDVSITWNHHDPGEVTDVIDGKDGPVVVVKSIHPMQVGDKMAGRYGDKGIVSGIVPDHQMPTDKNGKPFEVLLNPLGVLSRTNPSQWAETKLGAIAEKLGRPYKINDFDENVPDRSAWVEREMAKHGIPDTEDVLDPNRNSKIPNVYTGSRFFMKLHHTSESKGQGRSGGDYDMYGSPAKGGEHGSKRMALLETNALLSHGALAVVNDAHSVRGQANPEYWAQFMQGFTPAKPKVPMVYNKFVADLKASGINVVRDGSQLHIMAMTDKDVQHLAGDREIQSGETVEFGNDLKPIKGGLFDPGITGGHHGNQWSYIKLHEPMINPVMEEPVRRVLGLTQKRFESVLAGQEELAPGKGTGPSSLAKALTDVNVDRELLLARAQIQSGTKSARDAAIRKLGYLKSAKSMGLHPKDWVMTKVPVLPPQFRPINMLTGNKQVPIIADPNYLYKELFEANKNLSDMSKQVSEDDLGNERLAVYQAFKGVTGLGEPITQANKDRQVKGILAGIFGSSPKFSTVQRKLISATVDNVGRAVISPNPDLDMDTVGLPEDRAFEVYSRFIVRRLKRGGMPITEALQHVHNKSPLARQTLVNEMKDRPVIINRAPVLHRFGVMAFKPILVKGSAMQVSPLIVKGFNADFDGDAMQYHVPTAEDARTEALDRMLPSRQLLSPADFKTPVHVAGQEYIGGAFLATSPKFHSKRPPRYFDSTRSMKQAWERGEIGVNDPVVIVGK